MTHLEAWREVHVKHDKEMRLPVVLGECCREWWLPIGMKWGRCGLCLQVPEFKAEIPEEDWPRA